MYSLPSSRKFPSEATHRSIRAFDASNYAPDPWFYESALSKYRVLQTLKVKKKKFRGNFLKFHN